MPICAQTKKRPSTCKTSPWQTRSWEGVESKCSTLTSIRGNARTLAFSQTLTRWHTISHVSLILNGLTESWQVCPWSQKNPQPPQGPTEFHKIARGVLRDPTTTHTISRSSKMSRTTEKTPTSSHKDSHDLPQSLTVSRKVSHCFTMFHEIKRAHTV